MSTNTNSPSYKPIEEGCLAMVIKQPISAANNYIGKVVTVGKFIGNPDCSGGRTYFGSDWWEVNPPIMEGEKLYREIGLLRIDGHSKQADKEQTQVHKLKEVF